MKTVLTQEEADELIELLKMCVDYSLSLPNQGERADYKVVDIESTKKIFYVIVNRRNKYTDKCSFVLR